MPQGRIVLKSISQSKKLAELKTDGARLLYTWLIPNVDVNGCFSGDADVIKGQVFTRLRKSTKTIESYLQDMQENKLIILYEANGDKFLNIPDFTDKQPSLKPEKEGKTSIPVPTPELLQSYSRVTPPKVKESKVKESKDKVKHLDFVFLADDEHKKLIRKYGDTNTRKLIGNLNRYIGSSGKKYKSHYFTLLTFARNDGIPEIKTDKQKTADDKKALEKERQRIRNEDGQYYRDRTQKELEILLQSNQSQHVVRRWLIKEILQERK